MSHYEFLAEIFSGIPLEELLKRQFRLTIKSWPDSARET